MWVFISKSQSKAVMSAHGEVSQKSALKQENVRDVSIPWLLWIKFLKVDWIDCLFLKYGNLV